MTTGQFGLVLDAIGFVLIYFTGGFTFGISEYVKNEASKLNITARIAGFLFAMAGLYCQFVASGPNT